MVANNYVTGSQQKHGIIVSREVNNSFIINNVSEYNKGSGIMLDRMSLNNLVANNIARFNEGDGITVYESPNNILLNNEITDNQGTGVRVRNSWDINVSGGEVALNQAQAFTVYQDDLQGTGRDFEADPVILRAAVDFQNMNVESNNGLLKTEGFAEISVQNMYWDKGSMTSRNYYGDLEKFEDELNKAMLQKKDFILLSDKINPIPRVSSGTSSRLTTTKS
ncbi:MAG: right-handed parallel beta-helix repeat-containing protein [Pseudomonadota bacterium]